MDATTPDLRSLALDAYERGRRRLAMWRGAWGIPFGLFAIAVLGAEPTWALLATLGLASAFG